MKDRMDIIDFTEHVYYDPTSLSGLRWINNRYSGADGRILKVLKDTSAGSKDPIGYWTITLMGKLFLTHRVVWKIIKGGDMSGKQVDHIDGNKSNNSIENLRLITQKQNARNTAKGSRNKSGTVGVIYNPRIGEKRNPIYIARWRDLNGNNRTKTFSLVVYGQELAEFLAIEYRRHQIDLMNLMGAGYTDRHGT